MKKLITATMITTCLALCAAVWPQTEMVEETLVPPQTPAVSAPKQTVTEVDLEAVIALPAEEEKSATPRQELPCETAHEPEPVPVEVPAVPEVQPTPETKPAPNPAPAQAITNPQPGDMVYVEGFGWLECQRPGEATYAEDMYENGNKIGIMG